MDPVYEYSRDEGRSVTGGFVYTGELLPALRGHYVFGDFVSGRIWAIDLPGDDVATHPLPTPTALGKWPMLISTFGRDAAGELYVGDYGNGVVYRMVPAERP